jgi:hypothetical protein
MLEDYHRQMRKEIEAVEILTKAALIGCILGGVFLMWWVMA